MSTSLLFATLVTLTPPSGLGLPAQAWDAAGDAVSAAVPERMRARHLVTGGAHLSEPLPLIVALHGRGGRADGFMRRFLALGVPARVVALEGPRPLAHDGGFAWLSQRAKDAPHDQVVRELAEAAREVSEEIERLTQEYPTAGRPILVGYSQGGMVALTVAAQRPDLVGDVIAAASYLPPELGPRGGDAVPPRVHLVHGRTDAVVSHAWARATAAELRQAAWDVELHTVRGRGHQIEPRGWSQVLEQVRVALRASASG